MKLAFYKASAGSLWDKLIAWWTGGPYSHVELVFDWTYPRDMPVTYAGTWGSLCFSSSSRDKGARFKRIALVDGKWDVVDLDLVTMHHEEAAMRIAERECGRRYDWPGILGFIFPWMAPDTRKDFCSEVCVRILQRIGRLPNYPAGTTDPNDLYKRVNYA